MDFLATFLEEAIDLLEEWGEICENLDGHLNTDALNSLFRVAHSLKGSGKSVGLEDFGQFVHRCEDILSAVREEELPWSEPLAQLFQSMHQLLVEWHQGLLKDTAYIPARVAQFVEEFDKLPVEKKATKQAAFGFFYDEPQADTAAKVSQSPQTVHQNSPTQGGGQNQGSIRVSLAILENLARTLGEMTVSSEILRKISEEGNIADELTTSAIADINQLSAEANSTIQSIRLTPVASLLERLQKIALTTAEKTKKKIEVTTHGDDVELDKLVAEKIKDPLIHIVRNAVDHGIESISERKKAKKNPLGQLSISVETQGTDVIVQVRDDGKGIDPDSIAKAAINKGVIDHVEGMSDREKVNLILMPGFSTAEKITDISGRGVGLDVVSSTIQSLNGFLTIKSQKGKGTRFKVRIPSELSIIECLIIDDQGKLFALPLESVDEVFLCKQEKMQYLQGQGLVLCRDKTLIPIRTLSTLADHEQRQSTEVTDKAVGVLVSHENQSWAITFDSVCYRQTIFMKKLGSALEKRKDLKGLALLADGTPTLVLDLAHMTEEV